MFCLVGELPKKKRRKGGGHRERDVWVQSARERSLIVSRPSGMDDKAQDERDSEKEEKRQELIMHQYEHVCVCVCKEVGRENIAQLPQKAH